MRIPDPDPAATKKQKNLEISNFISIFFNLNLDEFYMFKFV